MVEHNGRYCRITLQDLLYGEGGDYSDYRLIAELGAWEKAVLFCIAGVNRRRNHHEVGFIEELVLRPNSYHPRLGNAGHSE